MRSMSKGDDVKRIGPNSLESNLQAQIIEHAHIRGWFCVKVISQSGRGMPDVVAVRAGRTVWIEVKREDEEARRQQQRRASEMRAHGAEVFEVDSLIDAREILR